MVRVGTALAHLDETEGLDRLRRHLLTWAPVHYGLSNAATAVAWADPEVMARHASLVGDTGLRDAVLADVLAEHARSHAMLERLYGGPLAERRPDVHAAIAARREGLRALHERQVACSPTPPPSLSALDGSGRQPAPARPVARADVEW